MDELLTVLDPIISAVQKLATARVVGGDEEGMGRLQRDVQHVTDAVQVCGYCRDMTVLNGVYTSK